MWELPIDGGYRLGHCLLPVCLSLHICFLSVLFKSSSFPRVWWGCARVPYQQSTGLCVKEPCEVAFGSGVEILHPEMLLGCVSSTSVGHWFSDKRLEV